MATLPEPLQRFDPQAVGQRLRQRRRKRNYKLHQLHALTGIALSQLSDFEHGKRNLTCAQLVVLAQVLGISANHLLGLPAQRTRRRGPPCPPPPEEPGS